MMRVNSLCDLMLTAGFSFNIKHVQKSCSPHDKSRSTELISRLLEVDELAVEGDRKSLFSGSLLLTFRSRFSKNPDESCFPTAGVNQACCKLCTGKQRDNCTVHNIILLNCLFLKQPAT